MEYNKLVHSGIKGMKWGVRRYQNEDGSLTPAGKERYSRDVKENNAKKKDNRIQIDGPDPNRWVREDMSRSKKLIDNTSDITGKLNQAISNRSKKRAKMDLSNMTDQQLRDRINRASLENQYVDMFGPETVSKGRRYAKTTLDAVGTVLGVGSSALAIALAIKELKG